MATTTPDTDIFFGLETLGNRFDAPILSIGAAAFNRTTGKIGKTFYQEIDIDSAIKNGTVTAGTVSWWIKQTDKAKRIFNDDAETLARKMHLSSALANLVSFVRQIGTPDVWGNGSPFDVTILERSIHLCTTGLAVPWMFWRVRDMRTIVDAAQTLRGFAPDKVRREGVHHNALDDAVHQAKVISAAWAALAADGSKVAAKPAPAQAPVEDDDGGL